MKMYCKEKGKLQLLIQKNALEDRCCWIALLLLLLFQFINFYFFNFFI